MFLVGVLFICLGLLIFVYAFVRLLEIFRIPFLNEKKLDRKLFDVWKKKQDYKDFKRKNNLDN